MEQIYDASRSQGTKFFVCMPCSLLLLLLFDYRSCSRAGVKPGNSVRKVDISKITPLTSPPSRTLDLSPPNVDLGEKRKEDVVEIEQVGEGGAGGDDGRGGGDDGRGDGDGRGHGGADIEAESSEATPRHTTYTKRSSEYEHVQGGSWDTHNPASADLPHAPRWNLTQGSRMTDLNNCCEFFSLSLPPAERLFQKRHHLMDLLDDHIHVGVNFFATSQEIAR
ncbi:hypothetical protein Hanom_Chr15g01409901 [Helianthus anomalus]